MGLCFSIKVGALSDFQDTRGKGDIFIQKTGVKLSVTATSLNVPCDIILKIYEKFYERIFGKEK